MTTRAQVGSHTLALMEKLDGRGRRTHFHEFLHQVVRHAVVVGIENDVVVDVDPCAGPLLRSNRSVGRGFSASLSRAANCAAREGSRASQFAALDKLALNPLPTERFDLSNGPAHGSTSTTTSFSIPTTTACLTTWCKNSWKCVRRPRPSSFSIRASVWLPTCARVVMDSNHYRTSSTVPPGASGMGSLAYGAPGAVHWPAHSAPIRTHP